MILSVGPAPRLKASLDLPASKSYSIRAYIIAACGGVSDIIRPSDCDDALVALAMARRLGSRVSRIARGWRIEADKGRVNLKTVNVGESGTVLRFLLPLLPFYTQTARVVGEGTLVGRPNHPLTALLRSQGMDIQGEGPQEGVPIVLRAGRLAGGRLEIEGTLSSQFISGLIIACPQIPQTDTQLVVKGRKIVSRDYIEMTRQILQRSGVTVRRISERVYRIPAGQRFKGLKRFIVPSDYGLAAFLLAAAVLTDSDVLLKGHFPADLIQADGRILDFFRRMGIPFQHTPRFIRIRGPVAYHGGEFSLKDCPDLLPVMAVLALFAKGRTRLFDVRHARVKESDRIGDLSTELRKVGASLQEKENELSIHPQSGYKGNILLDPHHDHRLAMAFAVMGLKIGCQVKDIECVAKSYPAFVSDLRRLGAQPR